jgi:hypothetical protein
LGEKLDVTFDGKATTPEEYEAALRGWIGGKAKDLSAEALPALARGMAEGVKRDPAPTRSPQDRDSAAASAAIDERAFRDHCQRVCFAYDDHYRPVEDAIERAAIPAESKKALRAHYGREFLVDWPSGRLIPALPVRGTATLVSALPARPFSADGVVAEVTNDERMRTAVRQVYGVTLDPKPEGLDKLLADLKHKDSRRWMRPSRPWRWIRSRRSKREATPSEVQQQRRTAGGDGRGVRHERLEAGSSAAPGPRRHRLVSQHLGRTASPGGLQFLSATDEGVGSAEVRT